MATKPANAAQKKWMSDISDACHQGIIGGMYGEEYGDCCSWQLHHVKGRSFRHNKVSIGHWFIIPVPFDLHDVSSNHPLNVTHNKHAFTDEFGKQSELFNSMIEMMGAIGYSMPPDDVYDSIVSTNI